MNKKAIQATLHQGLKRWVETQQDNLMPFIEQDGGGYVTSVGDTEHLQIYETDDELLIEVVFSRREEADQYGVIHVYGYGDVEVELESFLNEIVDFLRADNGFALSLDPPLDVEIDEDEVEIIDDDSCYQI